MDGKSDLISGSSSLLASKSSATRRAFKGQSDARGTNGLVRMGMLFFSSLPFPSFFLFLSVLPFESDSCAGILATRHYQARMITVKYPYPDLEEDQSNIVERTPPVRHLHPSIRARAAHTAYTHSSFTPLFFFFPTGDDSGLRVCGAFHQTIGWDCRV